MSIVVDSGTFDPSSGRLELANLAGLGGRRLRLTASLELEAEDDGGWIADPQDPGAFLLASAHRYPQGAIAAYCARLPAAAVEIASTVGTYELSSLRILLRCGRAGLELARSAPNLFWLLITALGEGELDLETAAQLVDERRTAILARCTGLPAQPALVRALEKIVLLRRTPTERRQVIEGLSTPHVLRELRACASIGIVTVRRLLQFRGWEQARWLRELREQSDAGRDRFGDARGFADDAVRLGTALGVRAPRLLIERLPSLAAVRTLHDRWDVQHRRALERSSLEDDPNLRVPFDDVGVVFAEDPRFRVLRSPLEVIEEGAALQHCAATYVERCRRSESVLVHVFDPPATLELRVDRGQLRIAQLRGLRNAPVSDECAEAVATWVAKAQRPGR